MKIKTIISCKLLLIPLLWLMNPLPCAQAAGTLINFDDVTDGTQINTHYPGVTFTNPLGGNIYARTLPDALSAPNLVSLFASGGVAFDAMDGAVDVNFASPVGIVQIDVRPLAQLADHSDPEAALPYIQAWDTANNFLGTVYYTGPLPQSAFDTGVVETLTITSPSGTNNIGRARFTCQQPVSGVRTFGEFDNLNYGSGFYTLSLHTAGSGSVAPLPNHATYFYGTGVSIQATPTAGWSFAGWSGGASGTANPLAITITSNTDITATFVAAPQTGPNFIVTTSDDHDDGVAGVVDCTLREAINAANANPDASTITFATNVTGVITLTLGELPITQNLTIRGPGTKVLSVSGNNSSRVFNVNAGTVLISDLAIINGRATGVAGSAGLPNGGAGGNGGGGSGGGIYNQGALTLSNCWVTGSTAQGGAGGIGGMDDASNPAGTGGIGGFAGGGGIFNSNSLTLINCTVSGNAAIGGAGGNGSDAFDNYPSDSGGGGGAAGLGTGGGIASTSVVNVTNSTISGNIVTGGNGGNGGNPAADGDGAAGGAGGSATGGGILCQNNFHMSSSTISLNSLNAGAGGHGTVGRVSSGTDGIPGVAQGGGLDCLTPPNSIQNSLIAGNSGPSDPDCHGSYTSQGYNLIGIIDTATGFTGTGDQTGTGASPLNPLLGPLLNLGGSAPTMELLPGSPAIDKGKRGVLTTDQRGNPRPYDLPGIANASGGDGSDIGAFELSQPVLTMSQSPSNVVLSWPVNYAGYTLQSVPQLTSPVTWTTVPISPVTAGSNYTVTASIAAGNQFYRLVWAGVAAVPGLFNTGVGTNGAILASGSVDPHWRLIQSADASFPGPNAMVVNDSGYPIPPWLANGPVSKWIAPQASETIGNQPGNYKYRITFDLTGLELPTAVVSGHWTSDDTGIQVLLNGVVTGFTSDGNFTVLGNPFSLSTGFVAGANTLDFVVNNGSGPTGVRVELSGTANFKTLP